MLSLRDTQAAFCAAILSEDAAPMRGLVLEDGIPAERRIQIYRNNNRVGSFETLQATYPVIERLGGTDWFRQSAVRYQREFPSRSGDLQNLGERYPEFLRIDLADTEYEYFADVAALEWAYQVVLTAEERPPVDVGLLRAIAPQDYEQLLFVPRPAVRLVESQYPIFAIWQATAVRSLNFTTGSTFCVDICGPADVPSSNNPSIGCSSCLTEQRKCYQTYIAVSTWPPVIYAILPRIFARMNPA